MLLRPFLNDAGSCASYLFGCTPTASWPSSMRTSISSTITSPRRQRSARRSWPCSRRTCRPITSPGCRSWSSAPARPRTCRRAPGSSSSTSTLVDGEGVELGNTSVSAIATPGHAPAHHAYTVTDRRRGEEPWLVFSGRLAADRRRRPPRLARRRRRARPGAAAAREPAPAPRVARSMSFCSRATMGVRSAAAVSPAIPFPRLGSSEPTTRC